MRPVTLPALASVAASAPVVLDYRSGYPAIGLQLIVTGSNTSTVQVTSDDVFAAGYAPASGNWFPVPIAALVNATASQNATLAAAVYTAVRLNMTTFISGGATLKIIAASTQGV